MAENRKALIAARGEARVAVASCRAAKQAHAEAVEFKTEEMRAAEARWQKEMGDTVAKEVHEEAVTAARQEAKAAKIEATDAATGAATAAKELRVVEVEATQAAKKVEAGVSEAKVVGSASGK